MLVYISGLLSTMVLMFMISKINYKRISITYGNYRYNLLNLSKILPILPLTLIAAIRYDVGQDYFYTYTKIFEKVVSGHAGEAWGDIGYTYLNKLVAKFSNDYASIFIVTAIIFCTCIFYAIYNNSENYIMSSYLLICSGYYFCFLNGMRQMIAVSILMISLRYIKSREGLKFALCIIAATMFHLTAVLFIPVYFLYTVRFNNYKRAIIVMLCYILARPLSVLISKLILLTKYSWYIQNSYSSERVGYISTMISIGVLIFSCVYGKEKDKLLLDLLMLTACVNAFIGKIPLASRVVWVFGTSTVFLSNIVESIKNTATRRIVKVSIYILYFIYFIYIIGVKNSNNVLPYKTIFER